jgi:hypothetical protein
MLQNAVTITFLGFVKIEGHKRKTKHSMGRYRMEAKVCKKVDTVSIGNKKRLTKEAEKVQANLRSDAVIGGPSQDQRLCIEKPLQDATLCSDCGRLSTHTMCPSAEAKAHKLAADPDPVVKPASSPMKTTQPKPKTQACIIC